MGKKGPATNRELWNVLINAFAEVEPASMEEVSSELREFGVDPEAVAKRFADRAAATLAKSPHDWRQSARAEREAALLKRRRVEALEGLEVSVLRQMVLERMVASPETQLHHRNLDEATASDLAELLADLEYLEGEGADE